MKRKKTQQSNPNSIKRKIREGYGQGEGEEYRAWLEPRNCPSNGLPHRPKSWKCGRRVIQLLSTLEYEVMLLLDWRDDVIIFYEQFPLFHMEETTEIARSLGVKPVLEPGVGRPIVMTSDFRVQLKRGFEIYSVKPAALVTQRVLEKFLVEKTYWARRSNTPCRLITDDQLPKALIASIRKIHPYYHLDAFEYLTPVVMEKAELILRNELAGKATMLAAAGRVDTLLALQPGSGLVILKHLFARKVLPLDPDRVLNFQEPLYTLCKS